MAFRKKADRILRHRPDILVVPECESPDKIKFTKGSVPDDIKWFGSNQHKGLGIFSYNNYHLGVLDLHNPELKHIIPIAVTGGDYDFTLYAIWASNPEDPDGNYITQVWKAIHYYESLITNRLTILTGDFNSNTIWDRPRRKGNHSHVVEFLESKGIHSAYHRYFNQVQGREQHPTLYMYRHKDKPYHIDYCFVSEDLAAKLETVEIGDYKTWIRYSDHVPVIVTFH